MARFGVRKRKRFRASLRIFPGRTGSKVGLITPGIKRIKAKKSSNSVVNKMVQS